MRKNILRNVIAITYFVTLLTMLFIIIIIITGRDKNKVFYGLQEYKSISHDWVDEKGNYFEFSEIDQYYNAEKEYILAFYHIKYTENEDISLFFRSKNTYVSVFLDEKEVYKTDVANHHFYNHSPGTRWNLISIKPNTKIIKLQIQLAYHDGRSKVDNLYIGDRARLIVEAIRDKIFGIIVSFLIFFVGIVILVLDITLNWRINEKEHSLLYLGFLAIIVSLWSILETNILQLFCADLRILQVMNNMLLVAGSMPVYLYLDCMFGIFKIKLLRALCIIDITYIILSTISQICGAFDYHQTLHGAVINFGIVSTTVICCVIYTSVKIKNKEKDKLQNLTQQLGITAIGLGLAGDFYRYLAMDVMDRAMFIRVGLLLFILCFSISSILAGRRQTELLKQKELELINSRIDIMLSQIQPHFLHNTLSTIENMIRKDSEKASDMICEFSEYLRENMNSLKQKELIPFKQEAKHITTYLNFEKARLKERLNVVYDFEIMDFDLPVLTVQPLVENAVRHGVAKKREGGEVRIATKMVSGGVEIIVEDNGAGFDPLLIVSDGLTHIGLENVRSRLMTQAGGILNIKSIIGVGTTITLIIPTERKYEHESNFSR